MVTENIRFNVIVPTRERADTLLHTLRTIVAQDYENLNILVSDNFSGDETKNVVQSFSDPRIKYLNTGKRLSMSANWEFALSHVSEGWVMYLGDDDGLYLGALQLLNELIQANNVEAVTSAFGNFQWPGHFEYSLPGRLAIPLTSSVKLKQSKDALVRAFSGRIPHTKLPWLYHGGAASIELINRARDENGRFFCAQIPDVYSAVALSSIAHKYLDIGIPIVVNGASKHSLGMAWMRSLNAKEEQPVLRFKSEANMPFHESLIIGKSEQIVMYECYLQSWHIHHGDLNISLDHQLRVAIKVAPSNDFKDIQEQCRMIASKNKMAYAVAGPKWLYELLRLPSTLHDKYFSLVLQPKSMGVENVYDAAMVSTYAYRFLRKEVWGLTLFLMINFIKRAVLISKHALFQSGVAIKRRR
jgi:glycosyltransferase involved in cell wall biosynthesis